MKNILIGFVGLAFAAQASLASVRGYNSSNLDLGIFTDIKCSTGVTCTNSSGRLNIVSSPTLTGPLTLESLEVLNNTTDDTVQVASEDNHTTFNILGFEAKNAILELWADQGDDAADKYSIKADTSDVLSFLNNTTAFFSFSSAGVMTLADSETITNASDVVSIGFDDAAAELKLVAFEATNSSLTLQADESDDNGDDWKLSSVASDDSFTISNDTSGSQVAKFTMSTGGNISMVGTLTGDGGDAMSGFLQKQVAATATTITAVQCGSTFINTGAVQMELPEASAVLGCRLTFITGNASNFDVNPDNADQILVQTNAAGDAMRNATLGNAITIEAISASQWAPVAVSGTWSDIN